MTFDEYKKRLYENTIRAVGQNRADYLMELYDEDLLMFYEDGWSVEGATTAMMMGY